MKNKIMKNIFLFLFFTSFSVYSQISLNNDKKTLLIGKIAPMGQLQIAIYKSGDFYSFNYLDFKYQELNIIKTFLFKDEDDAFNNLYKIFMDGFKSKKKQEIEISIPNGDLVLKFERNLGVTSVQILHYENNGISGFTGFLTKRKIKKLFGKK